MRRITIALLIVFAGCNSPSSPDDPRAPTPSGPPSSLGLGHCAYFSSTTTCPLYASWGQLYRSVRDVATVAEWTSSNARAIRVRADGSIHRVSAGEARIEATYLGKKTSVVFRAFADGPAWKVQPFPTRMNVRDQSGRPLEGVLVEITAGALAGATGVTNKDGSATVWNEFICGPVSVRVSKSGYRTYSRSFTNCGQDARGNWGADNLDAPITLISN